MNILKYLGRGINHEYNCKPPLPCQDRAEYYVDGKNGRVFLSIADGASTAEFAVDGAELNTSAIVNDLRKNFNKYFVTDKDTLYDPVPERNEMPSRADTSVRSDSSFYTYGSLPDFLPVNELTTESDNNLTTEDDTSSVVEHISGQVKNNIIDLCRSAIEEKARRFGINDIKEFSATLLFAVYDNEFWYFGHLGDGLITVRNKEGKIIYSSDPMNGKSRTQTVFTVSDNAKQLLRLARINEKDVEQFMMCSDGPYKWLYTSGDANPVKINALITKLLDEVSSGKVADHGDLDSYLAHNTESLRQRMDDWSMLIYDRSQSPCAEHDGSVVSMWEQDRIIYAADLGYTDTNNDNNNSGGEPVNSDNSDNVCCNEHDPAEDPIEDPKQHSEASPDVSTSICNCEAGLNKENSIIEEKAYSSDNKNKKLMDEELSRLINKKSKRVVHVRQYRFRSQSSEVLIQHIDVSRKDDNDDGRIM